MDEKCDFVEPVRKPLTLASAPIAEEPKEEEVGSTDALSVYMQ